MHRRQFLAGASLALNAGCASGATLSGALQSGSGTSTATGAAEFPKGFLWGASTAGHQVDGGNVNSDYWFLENLEESPFEEKSLDACDHYHRYQDDIKLLADTGLAAYRFSLEWARIEPAAGEFSMAAIEHYRRMLEACHTENIAPMVTYHHFTSPFWLAKIGGWENPETADRFASYAEFVTKNLGDLISHVCTINELNFSALLDALNFIPVEARRAFLKRAGAAAGSNEFSCPPFGDADKSSETMIVAHKKALLAIKKIAPALPVGLTVSMTEAQAFDGGEAHRDAFRARAEDPFVLAGVNDDFIGMQGYTRKVFGSDGSIDLDTNARLTQMGYEYWTEASASAVRRANELVPGVPVIVTESGVATQNDAERIEYIERSLTALQDVILQGADVRGYFHWSLMDNFEWTNGYRPKFGLFSVNRNTLARTKKPSAGYLGEIARRNRLTA